MPAMSVYLNDELYELVKEMEHDWVLQGRSSVIERFIRLGWAHWSGCLDETFPGTHQNELDMKEEGDV